jgi:hypothetical protein
MGIFLRLNVLKNLIINFNFITFSQRLNFSAGLAGKFCQELAALAERHRESGCPFF